MVLKLPKYPDQISELSDHVVKNPAHHDTIFDFKIVEACQEGNDVAWQSFYDTHFDFVFRMARRLGTPKGETEDVVHGVFVLVFQSISDFKGGNIRDWLYRVTAQLVSDRHRKRRMRNVFKKIQAWFGLGGQDTAHPVSQKSSGHAVSVVLQHMTPKRRNVFSMFEIEGVSGEEIGRRLNIPVNTVWPCLYQARKDFMKAAKRLGYLDKVNRK